MVKLSATSAWVRRCIYTLLCLCSFSLLAHSFLHCDEEDFEAYKELPGAYLLQQETLLSPHETVSHFHSILKLLLMVPQRQRIVFSPAPRGKLLFRLVQASLLNAGSADALCSSRAATDRCILCPAVASTTL